MGRIDQLVAIGLLIFRLRQTLGVSFLTHKKHSGLNKPRKVPLTVLITRSGDISRRNSTFFILPILLRAAQYFPLGTTLRLPSIKTNVTVLGLQQAAFFFRCCSAATHCWVGSNAPESLGCLADEVGNNCHNTFAWAWTGLPILVEIPAACDVNPCCILLNNDELGQVSVTKCTDSYRLFNTGSVG